MPTKKPDDEVGRASDTGEWRQSAAQDAVRGRADESPDGGGLPEPKSAGDWAARGASGGEPGRPPVALGDNSQGQGDRMPAGGATGGDRPATNPKTETGDPHES